MKTKSILYLILIIFFIGCENDKTPEIRQLDFYDYVIQINARYEDTVVREVGFLVKNPETDINKMKSLLESYSVNLLTKDFISETKVFFAEKNMHNLNGCIEVDFFRVSKELPWIMDADYTRPYHLGEGNPGDWIGRFIYDIGLKEFKYYAIFKRSKRIGSYGKITEEIKYYKDEELKAGEFF